MTTPERERADAERKAVDSLARYKFQMFGYWAAIWVHCNRMCVQPVDSPFGDLVRCARAMKTKSQSCGDRRTRRQHGA